jgi:hypothetical protein
LNQRSTQQRNRDAGRGVWLLAIQAVVGELDVAGSQALQQPEARGLHPAQRRRRVR